MQHRKEVQEAEFRDRSYDIIMKIPLLESIQNVVEISKNELTMYVEAYWRCSRIHHAHMFATV